MLIAGDVQDQNCIEFRRKFDNDRTRFVETLSLDQRRNNELFSRLTNFRQILETNRPVLGQESIEVPLRPARNWVSNVIAIISVLIAVITYISTLQGVAVLGKEKLLEAIEESKQSLLILESKQASTTVVHEALYASIIDNDVLYYHPLLRNISLSFFSSKERQRLELQGRVLERLAIQTPLQIGDQIKEFSELLLATCFVNKQWME
jgi:hypothetical protein